MKRKFRFLLPLIISSVSLTSCSFTDFLSKIGIKIVDEDAEAEYTPNQEVIDAYYKGYDLTKKGGKLELELQKHCFDKHKNYILYSQFNTYCNKTTKRNSVEAVADGSDLNQYFYTGKEATGYGTREHVWPCSLSSKLWVHPASFPDKEQHNVDGDSYIGGGSDLYHIRTCSNSVNSARSNSQFVDFDDPEWIAKKPSTTEVGESKGKYKIRLSGNSLCEPDDHFKGDIARILLYVWIHYADRGITPDKEIISKNVTYKFSDMVGDLGLTDIMGYSMERTKEVLKLWNQIDPVSNVEKLRNDTVQNIQGNRNPFVDYPKLVDQVLA